MLRLVDELRRFQGSALEALGFGPCARWRRTAHGDRGWALMAYQKPSPAHPCLLLPAPIKRAYIFDLAPGASVVARCLRAGFSTYLLEWQAPTQTSKVNGLEQYADRWLLEAVDTIATETGQRSVAIMGHSLGGTLATIFSALYPERVAALILLEAPVCFGLRAGGALDLFAAATARLPNVALRTATIPGSFLDLAAWLADPTTFAAARYVDWWLGTVGADADALRLHLAVQRWALDEMPMPRRLFEQVVEDLYRGDSFMQGTLDVNGRRALPGRIQSPILSVVDPRSRIVPRGAVFPFHNAVASAAVKTLEYDGDIGVAFRHVGILVGRTAHHQLWPEILRWIATHSSARA